MRTTSDKILPTLFFLLVILASCNDENPIISPYKFTDEPAVFTRIGGEPVIHTAHGNFYAPSLASNAPETGALLWTHFSVEISYESYRLLTPDTACYTAKGLTYEPLESSEIIIPCDLESFNSLLFDNYTENIDKAVLYRASIGSFLFFGFTHSDKTEQSNRSHDYEIFLEPTEKHENQYPMLYIRSKPVASNMQHFYNDRNETIHAFDMQQYVEYFRQEVSETGPVRFNVKYKIGNDNDGNDIYREFNSNPLTWEIQ